jgi:hypothetical protein
MQHIKSARHAQRFLSAHSRIHTHVWLRRHRPAANDDRSSREMAFRSWRGGRSSGGRVKSSGPGADRRFSTIKLQRLAPGADQGCMFQE